MFDLSRESVRSQNQRDGTRGLSRVWTVQGHRYRVSRVQWYPTDIGMFMSAGFDGRVHLWDTERQDVALTFSFTGNARDSTFVRVCSAEMRTTASGCTIAVATSRSKAVSLCDVQSGTMIQKLVGHPDCVHSVAWSPRREYLLASGGSDGNILLWDIRRSGRLGCLARLNMNRTRFPSTTRSSNDATKTDVVGRRRQRHDGDSQNETTAKRARTYEMLSLGTGDYDDGRAHAGGIFGLSFTPCGNYLVSSSAGVREPGGQIKVWAIDDHRHGYSNVFYRNTLVNFGGVHRWTPPPMPDFRTSFAIGQPAGSSRAVLFHPCDGHAISALRLHSGDLITRLRGHMEHVNVCVYRSSHSELYSGGLDGMILRWKCPSKPLDATMANPTERALQNENSTGDWWSGSDDDDDDAP